MPIFHTRQTTVRLLVSDAVHPPVSTSQTTSQAVDDPASASDPPAINEASLPRKMLKDVAVYDNLDDGAEVSLRFLPNDHHLPMPLLLTHISLDNEVDEPETKTNARPWPTKTIMHTNAHRSLDAFSSSYAEVSSLSQNPQLLATPTTTKRAIASKVTTGRVTRSSRNVNKPTSPSPVSLESRPDSVISVQSSDHNLESGPALNIPAPKTPAPQESIKTTSPCPDKLLPTPYSAPPHPNQSSSTNLPKALTISVALSPKSFISSFDRQPNIPKPRTNYQDLKIDVFLNGDFCQSTFIPGREAPKIAKSGQPWIETFSGRRMERLIERPWILMPPPSSTTRKSPNNPSRTSASGSPVSTRTHLTPTPHQRWQTINAALKEESTNWKPNADGSPPLITHYLQALSQTTLPDTLAPLSGTLGIIDVLIFGGQGRKDTTAAGYMLRPTRIRTGGPSPPGQTLQDYKPIGEGPRLGDLDLDPTDPFRMAGRNHPRLRVGDSNPLALSNRIAPYFYTPFLSRGSVVTYAERIGLALDGNTEEWDWVWKVDRGMGVYRSVRAERGGWFEEKEVVVGVRFVIGGVDE
ncbi:MAG: hypothetical protein M1834_002331 [Cirrosporium novae-zelandiae]|nr:MAG: hypothetical protein M1834_002331 [Cirrosporium novae-zelandiae]